MFQTLDAAAAEKPSRWHSVDGGLVVSALVVCALGLVMIYSATFTSLERAGEDPYFWVNKQVLYAGLGIVTMAALSVIDYHRWIELSLFIYVGTVGVLLGVLSPLGAQQRGIQAFYDLGPLQFQPSEFAKVGLIICLAAFCGNLRGQIDGRRIVTVLLLGSVPMALICLQPDLGTALVFAAILAAVLVVAGARAAHLGVLCALAMVFAVAAVQLDVLDQYQIDRFASFLSQSESATGTSGAGYNLEAAKTATANGGMTGQGLFNGTQTNNGFVPEQKNDFIFTAVGEQLGFVGASALLGAYAFLMWRIWRIAAQARDQVGTFICVGVLAMFVFQIFENIGMTMGIMPITGIPLPFMSYGGTSLIASFAAIGLVVNVGLQRYR